MADQANLVNSVLTIRKLYREFVTEFGEYDYGIFVDELLVRRGEWVAICGHTGSGKSTLGNMLGLRDRATHVETFRMLDIDAVAAWGSEAIIRGIRQRLLGITSQRPVQFDVLNVRENLEVRSRLVGQKLDAEWLDHLLQSFSCRDRNGQADLTQILDLPVHRISGGQLQRVELVRELSHRPELVILDEPTSNLDPHTATTCVQALDDLRCHHGLTIVMVTHDVELVRPFATQIVHVQSNGDRLGVIVRNNGVDQPAIVNHRSLFVSRESLKEASHVL